MTQLPEATDEDRQRHFRQLLRTGMKARHARKLATGRFMGLGLKTDTTFMAGRDDGFNGDDETRKIAHRDARRMGMNVDSKVYMPSFAKYRGDPQACVSGESDVKRLCDEQGKTIEGSINHKGYVEPDEPSPDEAPYRVADDIVQNEANRIVEQHDGDVTPKERATLVEETRERLSPTDGVLA